MEYPLLAVINLDTRLSLSGLFSDSEFSCVFGKLEICLSVGFTSGPFSEKPSSTELLVHINCKYYSADIIVREITPDAQMNSAEAVLICFDGEKVCSWESALEYMSLATRLNLPLRLLVCSKLYPDALPPDACGDLRLFHRLALEHEFELIELEPDVDTIEEGEEFGVSRLKSALEAHMWSNMKLHTDTNNVPVNQVSSQSAHSNNSCLAHKRSSPTIAGKSKAPPLVVPINLANDNKDGDKSSKSSFTEDEGVDDDGVESFERIFHKFMDTRERLPKLDPQQRRILAEKVILQLCRSVDSETDESTDGEDSTSNRTERNQTNDVMADSSVIDLDRV
ncbi:hypothetical protein EG68_00089 [Paragonimus skrjabini miyazakii]|uniref:Uncharacterized protein n=1 Tax=Paragonimus skrjabini miyazakii TaxID=59628 RepID=A0A8S9ZAE3_9TREM|nr:hypothetical protein EG68_00089 [Paragonimus skrjabini miyazakii]